MTSELGGPGADPLVRKLATILSADVAEFSRLMSEDEEGTLRTFRGHKEVFESLVSSHRGRVFNTAGDAILAEFNSAVEAVRCATDIQTALRTRNDKLPPNRQVRFRIGINLGDVMLQGQDLLGDGVNVAARLQTAAEPGGICIAGSVHDQIRNKLSLTFQSLGEKSYKNIAQPVRTFSVMESEGGHTLPTPKPAGKGGAGKWIGGVVAALVVIGGGAFWAMSQKNANKPPAAASMPAPAAQQSGSPAAPANSAGSSAADPPTSTVTPAPAASQPAGAGTSSPAVTKPADAVRKATTPVANSSAGADNAAAPSAEAKPLPAGSLDGVYAGQVCFEETQREPSRCFRGSGTVAGDRITGKWPMGKGKDSGLTMFLDGEVSSSGDVKMEMHNEKPDGSRVITVDFTGKIHDIHLDATGKFRMGRAATLNWHRTNRATAQQ